MVRNLTQIVVSTLIFSHLSLSYSIFKNSLTLNESMKQGTGRIAQNIRVQIPKFFKDLVYVLMINLSTI